MVPTLALFWVIALLAGVGQAAANHRDYLLAPESVCPGQTAGGFGAVDPVAVMECMHEYARTQTGRREVRPLESLEWSAERKAADILTCDEFSHTACGRGKLHWVQRTRIARNCYRVKENIAYRWPAPSVRAVMSGWLHSDAHRHALLMARHRWFGIGMVHGPFSLGYLDTAVWVAHFGYRC